MVVVTFRNEPEVIKKLLKAKAADYGLNSLLSASNILTEEPGFIHQFPNITITKAGASIEAFVGDQMDEDMGEFQPTTISVVCSTLKNISKTYDTKDYSNSSLARLIAEVVQQILFDNKEYEDPDNPGFLYVVDFLSSEAEIDSFISLSPIYSVKMTFSVLFRVTR